MDLRKENVEPLKDVLYEAVIGDARDRDAVKHLPVSDAAAVVVSLGEDITQSLLATLHVKELGARRIIVKGVTQEHGKILKSLGVDRVVFAEAEIARELGNELTWPNIIDYLPIGPDYSFVEIAAPESFSAKKMHDLNLRRRFGVWVVGVKNALTGDLEMFPDGEFRFGADQMLLLVGKQADLNRLRGREVVSVVPNLAVGAVVEFARIPCFPCKQKEFWRIPLQSIAYAPLNLELLSVHLSAVGPGRLGTRHGQYLRFDDATPLANLFVTMLDRLNVPVESFADSSG
jgi:trk system potassium uptake protein TrkA